MAEPHDALDGGLTAQDWVALWQHCHSVTGQGMWRIAWPDGGALMDQPAITVALFEIVSAQVSKALWPETAT